MKAARSEFEIAAGPGREKRTGYVLGGFAAHKEAGKGVYFWTFTHLKTGCSINVYPCHETKTSALGHLDKLADGTAPQCASLAEQVERFGDAWAMGMGQ